MFFLGFLFGTILFPILNRVLSIILVKLEKIVIKIEDKENPKKIIGFVQEEENGL